MKTEHKIIILMAAAGVLTGVVDAVLDTLFFYEESFLDQLAFAVPKVEIYARITSFLLFVIFGIVISRYFGKARRAEEKLRKSAETYRTLFENSPIQTMVVDADGKVTAFNLAKRLSGDRQPAIGDRMYVDYAGKHKNDMRAELMDCITSGKPREFAPLEDRSFQNSFSSGWKRRNLAGRG